VPARAAYWRDGKQGTVRLEAGPLGFVVDERSARAAVQAWRRLETSLLTSDGPWKPLPGTRIEVQTLARLVPTSTLLLGSEASEQNLDQLASSGKLEQFRLLHFATHGEISRRPEQSALILARDRLPDPLEAARPGGKYHSGRLGVEMVLKQWRLDADLVVLSCAAEDREADGVGLSAFAQAFLQKGARSVLVSRWKVEDTATALLMLRFYENLLGKRTGMKKPMGRAQALEEARDWLRKLPREEAQRRLSLSGLFGVMRGTDVDLAGVKGKPVKVPEGDRPFAHPAYWSAFVLIGDAE
jgi:CHAT domain-containing protein